MPGLKPTCTSEIILLYTRKWMSCTRTILLKSLEMHKVREIGQWEGDESKGLPDLRIEVMMNYFQGDGKVCVDQGCPTFYSSRAKFSCISLSRAAIAAVIKPMLSWELLQTFPYPKQVFSKNKSFSLKISLRFSIFISKTVCFLKKGLHSA